MARLRLAKDFIPVTEFKAQASDWLRKIERDGGAVVVTQHGRPAGVLISPAAFDALTESARFVSAIDAGLADDESGRVLEHRVVADRLASRYRPKRK